LTKKEPHAQYALSNPRAREVRLVRMKMFAGAVVTVVVGGLVVFGTIMLIRSQQIHQPLYRAQVRGTVQTANGSVPHAFLSLATYPDSLAGLHGPSGGPHPTWVSYGPSTNLWVPAHSLVTVTIHQYDSGESLNNPWFATVRGTVGGSFTLNGQRMNHIDPDHVAHTFTMRSIPSTHQTTLFVSVPLAPVADDAPALANGYPKPNVITFSFVTGSKGKYQWNCEYPCGSSYQGFGGPMSTLGYMSGTMTVG
jgi:hypothetical protein